MTRFGIAETDLTENRLSPQFIRLMEYEIERTEGFYDLACQGVQKLASGRWGVMCGLKIYQAILVDIRRVHYDEFRNRTDISAYKKLSLLTKSWWSVTFA